MSSRTSNPTTIPATQAHRQFGDLIRRAFSGQEHFIVEKDGLPVVAIISKQEYDDLMKEREIRQERLRKFDQSTRALGEEAARKGLTEEEIDERVEAVRQRLYDSHYDDSHK